MFIETIDSPAPLPFDPSEGFVASLPDTVTLDEVQRAPALLPAIKRAVDRDTVAHYLAVPLNELWTR